MLGQADAVQIIETFDYPPMDLRGDPFELWLFSISLDNWVSSAHWARAAEDHSRINTWNLDCVGRYAIPLSAALDSPGPEAEFRVDDMDFYVYGDIEPGFAKRFTQALTANPQITRVWLGSTGGSVTDAVEAGLLIRELGLDTALFGNCYSACPLVFMAGTRREIWAGSAPHGLGFHQISTANREAAPPDHPAYGLIVSYVSAMAVDPVPVLNWMLATPPSDILEPGLENLCAAAVATFVQRVCTSD